MKSLLINVVLHWIDLMAGLEFDSLIDIASQDNFEGKKKDYIVIFWSSTACNKVISPFKGDDGSL